MARGGRKRRSEERPDTEFGKALKAYVRRIEGFTQKQLADESYILPETLSRMVKGEREPTRDHVRAIIKVLYQRNVLLTLDEANALIRTVPTNGALDDRDTKDREIIELFDPPVTEVEQGASQRVVYVMTPNMQVSSDNLNEDEILAPDIVLEPLTTPPPVIAEPEPASEPDPVPELVNLVPDAEPQPIPVPARPLARDTRRRQWWYISSGLALLVIVGGILVVMYQNQALSHQGSAKQLADCSAPTNGVTLYTDTDYKGQCHTFGPGDYELARYGLEQNVSSIRDWNNAYFVKIFDTGKNFYDFDKSIPTLPADWDNRADMLHIEKHRPTSCHPGMNGIIAFINPDYSGGCLFITGDIPDLTLPNFDSVIVSIQFVGVYRYTMQLVIYSQPNYKGECGRYWQNQSDLEQCARLALSVRVLPFTPPTPIPTVAETHYAGNVGPDATISPGSAGAVIDGSVQTEWIAGHMVGFALRWAFPVTVHRIVIWDRKQSATDNNQINKLKFSFSDGTATGSIDMISDGPRCADVTFPPKNITSLQVIPVDASGNNGYSEIEVWATTGPQYSNNTCVNTVVVPQAFVIDAI